MGLLHRLVLENVALRCVQVVPASVVAGDEVGEADRVEGLARKNKIAGGETAFEPGRNLQRTVHPPCDVLVKMDHDDRVVALILKVGRRATRQP